MVAVEAGGYLTAADYTQQELEMLPLLYQDAGLRATADKAIGILQGKGVGGSTLHNTGLVYPRLLVSQSGGAPSTASRWMRRRSIATPPRLSPRSTPCPSLKT